MTVVRLHALDGLTTCTPPGGVPSMPRCPACGSSGKGVVRGGFHGVAWWGVRDVPRHTASVVRAGCHRGCGSRAQRHPGVWWRSCAWTPRASVGVLAIMPFLAARQDSPEPDPRAPLFSCEAVPVPASPTGTHLPSHTTWRPAVQASPTRPPTRLSTSVLVSVPRHPDELTPCAAAGGGRGQQRPERQLTLSPPVTASRVTPSHRLSLCWSLQREWR